MAYQPFLPTYLRERAEGLSANRSNRGRGARENSCSPSDETDQTVAELATVAGVPHYSAQAVLEGEVGVSALTTKGKYNNNYNLTIILEDSLGPSSSNRVREGGAATVATTATVHPPAETVEPATVATLATLGPRRCSCGEVAHFGVGWLLRGPGGERWYCASCCPAREEVISVAGGPGESSLPFDSSPFLSGGGGSTNARRGDAEPHLDWWRRGRYRCPRASLTFLTSPAWKRSVGMLTGVLCPKRV